MNIPLSNFSHHKPRWSGNQCDIVTTNMLPQRFSMRSNSEDKYVSEESGFKSALLAAKARGCPDFLSVARRNIFPKIFPWLAAFIRRTSVDRSRGNFGPDIISLPFCRGMVRFQSSSGAFIDCETKVPRCGQIAPDCMRSASSPETPQRGSVDALRDCEGLVTCSQRETYNPTQV